MRVFSAPLSIVATVLIACSSDYITVPARANSSPPLPDISGIWSMTGPDQISYQFELARQSDGGITGTWKGVRPNCLVDCEIAGDVTPGGLDIYTRVSFEFVATTGKRSGIFGGAIVDKHTLTGTVSLWDQQSPDPIENVPAYSGPVTLKR
jgi:hypothetical protein